MRLIYRISVGLLGGFLFLVAGFRYLPLPVQAEKNAPVTIHFFWAQGCPHCNKEKAFLSSLESRYPIRLRAYEVSASPANAKLLNAVGQRLSADVSGVPFTVIGDQYIVGYQSDQTTGAEIEVLIVRAMEQERADIVDQIDVSVFPPGKPSTALPEKITIPLFGTISIRQMSLPVLTLVIAFMDGFNPCAMWVLVFLISLLIGMQNRLKMFFLGFSFIAASGLVYFLFLSAWLNVFLFLGFIAAVRVVIGLVALGAGAYNLKEYIQNPSGACKVTGGEKRRKIFDQIRTITQNRTFLVALFGILLLAVAVNMVELVCSAGLPAIYTQVLTMSNLPVWQYYLYLIFYVLIFMLDDLIVFFVAMATLQVTGIFSRYTRLSHLVGGILMLMIGLLMIFRPDLLMFG